MTKRLHEKMSPSRTPHMWILSDFLAVFQVWDLAWLSCECRLCLVWLHGWGGMFRSVSLKGEVSFGSVGYAWAQRYVSWKHLQALAQRSAEPRQRRERERATSPGQGYVTFITETAGAIPDTFIYLRVQIHECKAQTLVYEKVSCRAAWLIEI